MSTWLQKWLPEENDFWEKEGKKTAWRTLTVTTIALVFSFATWFMMSALVVKLPGLGFKFNQDQLFWLAAIPGLAGGSFRIIHTFLLPIYGTRHVITFSTLIKIIPCVGIGLALMDTTTPFWVFMILAFLLGFGGGDFSSFMPSTNMFFPKRLKGTALGIQAGIGNFGVSLAQFVTPLIIGIAIYGTSQQFTKIDAKELAPSFATVDSTRQVTVFAALDTAVQSKFLSNVDKKIKDSVAALPGAEDKAQLFRMIPNAAKAKAFGKMPPKMAEATLLKFDPNIAGIKNTEIWIQSGAFWYIPILLLMGIVCWFTLKSIPMKVSFKEQLDIFGSKHTWFCTITYMMTFGGFAGLAAAFPMMIKSLYGNFPGAPDPLTYAFYGPLIGSASRVVFGFVADKVGGAVLTTLTGVGLIAGGVMLVTMGLVAPTSMESFPMFVGVMLGLFLFTGIGNAGTFRQYPIIFGSNQRQAAGVLGFTAAIAAFGPFIFNKSIGSNISASGNANMFFYCLIGFAVLGTIINWYYYQRKGCERPS